MLKKSIIKSIFSLQLFGGDKLKKLYQKIFTKFSDTALLRIALIKKATLIIFFGQVALLQLLSVIY